MVAGVILAAGAGRRFGAVKALASLHGRPLVARAVEAMAAADGVDAIHVVVGAHAAEVAAVVRGADVVECVAWAEGMSASLRAGVAAARAGGADAVVITLADQPLIGSAAIARVGGAAGTGSPARASYDGVPGHPVLLAGGLLARVDELRGDEGARTLLDDAVLVECGDVASPEDADTPEALAALANRLDVREQA